MGVSNRTLILIAALVLAAATAALVLLPHWRTPAAAVRITVGGEEYGVYPLDTDATVTIAPEDGSWYNILTVCGGSARITSADCPTQTCVHTPALTRNTVGVIVCLPHNVVVQLQE